MTELVKVERGSLDVRLQKIQEAGNRLLNSGEALTVNQRANLMAIVYYEAVKKMMEFKAIAAICRAAIETGDWTDRQIATALWKLAHEGRPLTKQTLRIAITGLGQVRSRHQQETDDLFDRWEQRIQEYKKVGLA